MRQCLQCSFRVEEGTRYCPKCDADLRTQSDGSQRTIDIAHRHETVEGALDKLRRAVDRAGHGLTGTLRVVVGQGLIREAVEPELRQLRARKKVHSYRLEPGNPGAYLVRLKR
ncbi:MAG: Smr/MutS family protein [Gemmatimonadota bacterium]